MESFGAVDKAAIDTLVKCINKESTLETMTAQEISVLKDAVEEVFNYNQTHQDNIIPLSVLGVSLSDEDRLVYNNVQVVSMNMLNELPKNATVDQCMAYKDANLFMQLSYEDGVLKPTYTKDGVSYTKYVGKKSLDGSCLVITYLYSLKALDGYTSDVMQMRAKYINEYFNDEIASLCSE